jgi:hypothetical protein
MLFVGSHMTSDSDDCQFGLAFACYWMYFRDSDVNGSDFLDLDAENNSSWSS